nr:TauD/TfdA family dioxygenase [Sphingomonas sp. Y57]
MKIIAKSEKGFGASVRGLDLTKDPQKHREDLEAALAIFSVLHLQDQDLSDQDQLTLSGLFGTLNISFLDPEKRRTSDLRLNEVSNLRPGGTVQRAGDPADYADTNLLWHTDLSFKRPSARLTFLNARELPGVPPPTEYCDMRAAWDALPVARQVALEGLEVEHSAIWARSRTGFTEFSDRERAKVPPVRHPLVRTHHRSGRKSLYLSSSGSHIIGWPVDEGRALLEDLMRFATQDEFLYRHEWKRYDLLIWDDSTTVHRAVPFMPTGERRVLRWSAALEEVAA